MNFWKNSKQIYFNDCRRRKSERASCRSHSFDQNVEERYRLKKVFREIIDGKIHYEADN